MDNEVTEPEKKTSLYKYDEILKNVIENGLVFNEETGEVIFTDEDLGNIKESIDKKLNNIIGLIKDKQLESDLLSAKAKAMDEIYQEQLDTECRKPAKRLAKEAESLTNYLDGYMKFNNLPELKAKNGTAKYSKSTVCEVDEVAVKKWLEEHPEFKEKFLKTKEPEVSKSAIKDYLKESQENEVTGASLVDKKTLKVGN
jgi:hypothetical protein